jgi:hypothetical protein
MGSKTQGLCVSPPENRRPLIRWQHRPTYIQGLTVPPAAPTLFSAALAAGDLKDLK